jgi:hypothetical protein
MSQITITRTDKAMPVLEAILDAIRGFLFGVIDGFTKDDRKAWRRLWHRIKRMEPGEMMVLEVVQPRLGWYHRKHMALEQQLFDSQDRFDNFEMLRVWLKIGAGWVTWAAGPKGGVVPIPKSVSYSAADQDEFERFHGLVVEFLRGEHAAKYLWPHLKDRAHEMMDQILEGFGE